MRVLLLPVNQTEVINKLYTACRTCYSAEGPIEIWNKCLEDSSEEALKERLKLIKYVIKSGHLSTVEHQQLTFCIEGVTRACSMQMIRHRITSVSQQSQRYCDLSGELKHEIPDAIKNNPEAFDVYKQLMTSTETVYNTLVEMGIKPEDARAVLPNSTHTNFVWSMNLREFINICGLRLCACAQKEARVLVMLMADAVGKELPFLKPYLVPQCERLGYCPESKKRSCGRKPVKSEALNVK